MRFQIVNSVSGEVVGQEASRNVAQNVADAETRNDVRHTLYIVRPIR